MSTHTSAIGALLGVFTILIGGAVPALADHKPAASIPTAALIQPADFAATLNASAAPKPLILQVGFRKAYAQAHIPGSEYVGAASEEDGVQVLQQRVAKLPKDSAIVIYCGCCPWAKCPNIAAAYDALHDLGFKNVKVIYIADDFGTNWVDQGFPTAKGS
ncbi:MAG TPA: rhodanese-like domain-containing protein [Steroidobacteraceae bacterium]|nr:rhodanese-like domain-containing protein [Steroidobacteraceae bacterium]